LTFAINGKIGIMTVVCSELSNCSYNHHIFAISNKDAALNWSSKNEAVFTVININICSNIKNEIDSIFTVLNIKLLSFDRIN
jgi:hypothetical protein